jgi:hypothetical protein
VFVIQSRATVFLLGLIVFDSFAYATDVSAPELIFPILPKSAINAAGFVPQGWRIDHLRSGDLNKDGKNDFLLVLIGDDPAKILALPPAALDYANTNPRMLAIAFANSFGTGFDLVLQDHTFIPQTLEIVFDDPLQKDETIIQNGTLLFGFFRFGGSIARSNFRFRYQQNKFALIGFESINHNRSSGADLDKSVNYLTHKIEITEGNMDSDITTKTTKKLNNAPLLTLEKIDDALNFNVEE